MHVERVLRLCSVHVKVDIDTGEVRWKWSSEICRGQFLVAADRFIHFGEYGHLASTDVDHQRAVVRAMTEIGVLAPPCYTAPALADGRLYLRNEEELVCIDLRRNEISPVSPKDVLQNPVGDDP